MIFLVRELGCKMRTTINIRDELVEDLLVYSKARNKSKAIEVAIKHYIQKKAIEDLIALSGKIDIDPDWQKAEEMELHEYEEKGLSFLFPT
jgi:metal-responsive CopG/Arc/MetJ family transcriptional regulator